MEKRMGHLTRKELEDWTSGLCSTEKELELLAHAGVCDHCAGLLSAWLEQDLLEPPAYLQEEILEKSQSIEFRTASTIRQTSRQMRLFLYSLKVGFALAVSLYMLFVLPMDRRMENQRGIVFLENTRQSVEEKMQNGKGKLNALFGDLAEWPLFMDEEESK